jgi:D-lactate dehydrogenase (cytochrome)
MDKQAFLDKWQTLNRHIHDMVREYDGSFSAEHGIGRMKVPEMARYKSKTELELMAKIKNALDPDNIMNPGVILE